MNKSTKIFIGTIGGALAGSILFGIKNVIDFINSYLPLPTGILPLIGLIIGGIIGYYVARNS